MIIVEDLFSLRQYIRQIRLEGKRVALVPTMGNLHDGHIRLINEAKARADIVFVSIFVNPMQFDCVNDLMRYPRTLQEDYENLRKYCVDFVFTPTLFDIYPNGTKDTTYISVPKISTILEGAIRPMHFYGVATVVSKLFNLIQPDIACFGEKDYQQLMVIRKMVSDMNYDIDIVSIPTIRSEDGLALSSRNNHLNTEQRKIAPCLNRLISVIAENIDTYQINEEEIISFAMEKINKKGFHIDYVCIRDADTLLNLTNNSKCAVILASARIGKVRLIDNKVVKLAIKK